VLGILFVLLLLPRAELLEAAALGFGLGVAGLTWLLFLLSWAGIPLTPATILILYGVLAAAALLLGIRLRRTAAPAPRLALAPSEKICEYAGWVLLGLLGLALMVVSVGLSYYYWDAMAIWSVKGYGIGLQASIFAARVWGAKGLAYPLNIPLAISIFYRFDGDALPGSKLLFPAYYISLLAGLHLYFRSQKLPAWINWVAVFLIATIPLLLQYSLIGYANIPDAYYYALGLLWIGMGIAGADLRRAAVGSLLLAFTIWTRLEGLEFWLIAVVGLGLVWGKLLLSRRMAAVVLLPGLLVGGVWTAFALLNHASSGETQLLQSALVDLVHGVIHPGAVVQILRYTVYIVVDIHEYGFFGPPLVGLALLLAVFHPGLRHNRSVLAPAALGLLTALGVMFMYYLTSYDPAGVEWWLGTGYDRMLFGALVLLLAGSGPILWKTWSGR
jgi:hypothetical protein